jgi:hypothetical protein
MPTRGSGARRRAQSGPAGRNEEPGLGPAGRSRSEGDGGTELSDAGLRRIEDTTTEKILWLQGGEFFAADVAARHEQAAGVPQSGATRRPRSHP